MKQIVTGKVKTMEKLFVGVGYEALIVLLYSGFLFLLLCLIMRSRYV